jgi:predicted nucleotidyltransferase
MKPSDVLRLRRDQLLAIAKEHGAEEVRVFGSAVRAQDRESSDLDLLVRFAPGTSLLDVSALHLDLEDLLGCAIDIVSEGGLVGKRGERIRREAKRI